MVSKKFLVLCLALMLSLVTACGNGSDSTNNNSDSSADTSTNSVEKQKLVFWYSHTGEEGQYYVDAVNAFNASQDVYEVEPLSVTDQQKYIVAMAGNEAPDIVEVSNQNIITYAGQGLIEPLSEYAQKDNYKMEGVYAEQAMIANTLDETLYGVPLSSVIIQMFYNKDILDELGYDAPPTTMEELYKMAIEATQTDESGTITRLGYPLFPLASARQELIYAFGGRWWSEDGLTVTPNDPQILDSLAMNVEYREQYGIQKVQEFVATANTNRYTENDMFFAGKQLFRFDGTWLATMIDNYNSDLNYGVALIPGTEAHPDDLGASRYETTSLAIPVVATEKQGAWEFIKFLSNSEETKKLLLGNGNLPALLSLYDDEDILTQPNFDIFVEALKLEKGIQYPKITDLAKYNSLIESYLDYVYNGLATPEEAMENLAVEAELLQ